MAELTVQIASRPILQAKTEYDVEYEYDNDPVIKNLAKPQYMTGTIDLMSNHSYIVTLRDTMPSSGVWIYGEDWTYITGSVTIDGDPTNPYSKWHIAGGPYDEVWYASSGLLPAGYSHDRYDLAGINYLRTYGVYQGRMLYKRDENDNIVPMCSAVALTTVVGSVGTIEYSCDLQQKFEPYDVITVTGTSIEGRAVHSPFSVLALMDTYNSFAARGKMQGEITMTETPIT